MHANGNALFIRFIGSSCSRLSLIYITRLLHPKLACQIEKYNQDSNPAIETAFTVYNELGIQSVTVVHI